MKLGEAIREMEASLGAAAADAAAAHWHGSGSIGEHPSAALSRGARGLGRGQRMGTGRRSLTASNSSSVGMEAADRPLRKAARPPKAPKPPMSPNPLDDPSLPVGLRSSSYRLDHHDKVRSIDPGGGAPVVLLPPIPPSYGAEAGRQPGACVPVLWLGLSDGA